MNRGAAVVTTVVARVTGPVVVVDDDAGVSHASVAGSWPMVTDPGPGAGAGADVTSVADGSTYEEPPPPPPPPDPPAP